MANVPSLTPESPAAPKTAKPKAPAAEMKWYRVKSESKRIPRPHGDYQLNRGKVINSANFDIQLIKNLGVELEDVPEPGWHAAKQGAPAGDAPDAA
jgi:hypothetical protein